MKQVKRQKFQIIEIDIAKAGSAVALSKTTETDHDNIIGVALLKKGGKHGSGTFSLKIDGDEIFPNAFHADIITLNNEDKNITLKDVLWPVNKPGSGSTIQLEYKEPANGTSGKMWLYLLAEKLESTEG